MQFVLKACTIDLSETSSYTAANSATGCAQQQAPLSQDTKSIQIYIYLEVYN